MDPPFTPVRPSDGDPETPSSPATVANGRDKIFPTTPPTIMYNGGYNNAIDITPTNHGLYIPPRGPPSINTPAFQGQGIRRSFFSPRTEYSMARSEPETEPPKTPRGSISLGQMTNPWSPQGPATYDGTRWVPINLPKPHTLLPQEPAAVYRDEYLTQDLALRSRTLDIEDPLARLSLGNTSIDTPEPPQPAQAASGIFRPMESLNRHVGERRPSQETVILSGHSLDTLAVRTHRGVLNALLGFSPKYRGDTSLLRNRSADIPESHNCSLFVMGLPPDTTIHALLSQIRNVGRIYATHINRPEPDRGHFTCAAKIIFFEREAAQRFYARCQERGFALPGSGGGGGQGPRVVWNRIRTAQQDGPKHKSRVLIIAGDRRFVNTAALTAYFRTKLDFQIDEVLTLADMGGRAVVEFRFGSYRCQAEAAKMALAREYSETVKVYYGEDPCAFP
ncbi:hypothetical protein NKR23_g6707 [Pleurostoma richardsiae]|uniref:RRM domain-containing protein n=1 Tax=Pleurostoma richardsiae TaxID=41990 RepID=A0AA38VHI4_9PEZI|nr:hypothetical protein NKR23_g6707 [Pleurostoma richardsiae]